MSSQILLLAFHHNKVESVKLCGLHGLRGSRECEGLWVHRWHGSNSSVSWRGSIYF